jgi:hypothetical protein
MASFGDRVVGAMKLDVQTFEEIERDPAAMGQAVGVLVLAAVSAGLGNLYYGGISGILIGVIGALVGYAAWAAIVWLIGTKLMPEPTTKAEFAETFRVVAFATAPGLLRVITIIPILGWLIGFLIWLWMVAAMVVAVRQVLDYSSTAKAIVVVILGFITFLIIYFILLLPYLGARMIMG